MTNVRENSQQDRRVYVGNLSYDVKWHHLKDFMRQGQFAIFGTISSSRDKADPSSQPAKYSSLMCCFSPMGCQRWADLWLVLWLFSLEVLECVG